MRLVPSGPERHHDFGARTVPPRADGVLRDQDPDPRRFLNAFGRDVGHGVAAKGLGGVFPEHMRHRILGQVRLLREDGVESPADVVVIGRVRVGDSFLLLSMVFVYLLFGTVSLPSIFVLAHSFVFSDCSFFGLGLSSLTAISILLFLGAMGKSAQLGLHTWLPDAMEGPTPVSALIHAATMVTAGVFLVVRFSPIFEYSAFSLAFVSFLGSLTAFFASTIALFQFDLKKIVAYSTCSQLGYMFLSCGLSSYSGAMFHLYNHAFFKALLFLGAGLIIHVILENQDLRRMGGLLRLISFSYSSMLIGSFSLMGFPFLTGFYSKDFILESIFVWFTLPSRICLVAGLLAAFLTSFYSIRVLYLVFISFPRLSFVGYTYVSSRISELYMVFSITILSFFSLFVGYLSREFMVGLGTDFWSSSVFTLSEHCAGGISEFIPFYLKAFPVCFSFFGMVGSCFLHFWFSHLMVNLSVLHFGLFNFFSKKWHFDLFFNATMVRPVLRTSYFAFFRNFDRGVLEFFGPFGFINFFMMLSRGATLLQTGYFYHYIFLMVFFLICLTSSIVFCFYFCKFFFLFFFSVCFPIFLLTIFTDEEEEN